MIAADDEHPVFTAFGGYDRPSEMRWTLRIRPQPSHGSGWLVRGIERTLPDWDEYLAPLVA